MQSYSPSFDTSVDQILGAYFLCPNRAPLDGLEGVLELRGQFWVGFRYLDPMAGASVNVELFCDVTDQGQLVKTGAPLDLGARWVFRSGVIGDLPASVLSERQIAALGLPREPEWLRFYNQDLGFEQSAYVQGRVLNSAGKPQEALRLLERAWRETPNHPAVAFETLFAFNASNAPQKSIEWLGQLEEGSPVWDEALVWREIGFAFGALGQISPALGAYQKALELLAPDDRAQKAEIAYNAGTVAHQLGDGETRNAMWSLAWASAPEDSMIHRQLKALIKP